MNKEHTNSRANDIVQDGQFVTPDWLMERQVSRSLMNNWLRSGQLVKAAHGVYRLPGPPLKWQAVVYSLQQLHKNDFVVGGMTALEMQGLGHFVSMAEKVSVHLYHRTSTPAWLSQVQTNAQFALHHAGLFEKSFSPELKKELWGSWDWPLLLSTPEQAILELLNEVPQNVPFENADLIMQGLVNLSPSRLETLLQYCSSVKVKRLFFWFAERQNHVWLKKLDIARFDLGAGKRVLVEKGTLDKKYLITVPKSLKRNTEDT